MCFRYSAPLHILNSTQLNSQRCQSLWSKFPEILGKFPGKHTVLFFCTGYNFLKSRNLLQNFLKSGNFLKTGISELNWMLHAHFYWVSHSWDWMHSTLRPMVNECSLTYNQQTWKDSVLFFCFWCRSLLVMCKISFSVGGHLWTFSILFLPKNTQRETSHRNLNTCTHQPK